MGLTVSEKSVFATSFGRGRFQGNLFSFILIIFILIYRGSTVDHSGTVIGI